MKCVLLGYPADHRSYRCLDLATRHVITSRHVVFDEDQFPFRSEHSDEIPTTAEWATVTDSPVFISPIQSGPAPSPPASAAPTPSLPSPQPSPPASTAPAGPIHHHMITRARAGIHEPNPRYAMTADSSSSTPALSPIPSSARAALKDPNWRAAMALEYDALQRNRTWRLVDRPPGAHIVSGKWVFCHKLNPDGTLERYKARWVVLEFTQRCRFR